MNHLDIPTVLRRLGPAPAYKPVWPFRFIFIEDFFRRVKSGEIHWR